MKKFFLFAALFIVAGRLQAQLPDLKKTTQNVTGMTSPGRLLTQFTDAIKPAAFLSSWSDQKSSWLNKAGKITSAISMVQSLSSLTGFLKPDAFKKGFDVQKLLQTANTVKTMSSAAGLLKNLESGLAPESLSDSWGKQRGGWLSALDLLK